jgi:hypothetical protein
VRGLRGSLVAGAFVEDRFDRPVEGEGTPEAGFVLPPLARCRSVPGAVVG